MRLIFVIKFLTVKELFLVGRGHDRFSPYEEMQRSHFYL